MLNRSSIYSRFVCASVAVLTVLIVDAGAVNAQSAKVAALGSASVLPLESNGEPLEVAAFAGVRVVRNGSVLFAESKPASVKLRSGSQGTIQQLARNGAGPGEYRAAPQFIAYRGDSIAAYDAGQLRWSVLSPTGAFVRVLANGPEAAKYETRAAWIAEGAMVFNASLDSTLSPRTDAINKIVLQDGNGGPLVIRQAENGNLWAASALVSSNWTVYNPAGTRLASHRFPTPFRLMFANDTTAIGDILDQDDAPQLMTLRFKKLPVIAAAPSKTGTSNGTLADVSAAQGALKQTLRRMVMQQERAYSDGKSYTMVVDSLRLEIPSTMSIRIVQADARGWFGIAIDKTTRATCAMGVGYAVIGWQEARPYCSK